MKIFLSLSVFLLITGALFCEELKYPELYSAELPRYENATLLDIGRQARNLQDGISLILVSPDSVPQIAEYYESTMKDLGWMISERRPGVSIDRIYAGQYAKGDKYFHIMILYLGEDETQIKIKYAQR